MESNFIPMVLTKHYFQHQPMEQMISSLSAYSMGTQDDWETRGQAGRGRRRKNYRQEERKKFSDFLATRGEWREAVERIEG